MQKNKYSQLEVQYMKHSPGSHQLSVVFDGLGGYYGRCLLKKQLLLRNSSDRARSAAISPCPLSQAPIVLT